MLLEKSYGIDLVLIQKVTVLLEKQKQMGEVKLLWLRLSEE